MSMKLIQGDCLEVMKALPDNSVDACVTDPPYGLKFMGKKWDYDVPTVEQWKEVYRVMKPGAFLLSFGGTRTYHRMVVNIEDAGFEIRDQIQWLYGSGFPKSLSVGKAIDRAAGAKREIVGYAEPLGREKRKANQGKGTGNIPFSEEEGIGALNIITAPATPEAEQWDGWGTALKPANEPICLARKPIEGTVAANVLKWGTGGLNIDGCRVGTEENCGRPQGTMPHPMDWGNRSQKNGIFTTKGNSQGRFPANVIHSGEDEVVGLFPDTKSGAMHGVYKNTMMKGQPGIRDGKEVLLHQEASEGSAARFFYVAKASKAERGEGNNHVTVKPLKLMCYLCRLVTPPGGTVLDCYVGSGTTGVAAQIEGFDFIGIDKDIDIATRRIENTDPLFQAGEVLTVENMEKERGKR